MSYQLIENPGQYLQNWRQIYFVTPPSKQNYFWSACEGRTSLKAGERSDTGIKINGKLIGNCRRAVKWWRFNSSPIRSAEPKPFKVMNFAKGARRTRKVNRTQTQNRGWILAWRRRICPQYLADFLIDNRPLTLFQASFVTLILIDNNLFKFFLSQCSYVSFGFC